MLSYSLRGMRPRGVLPIFQHGGHPDTRAAMGLDAGLGGSRPTARPCARMAELGDGWVHVGKDVLSILGHGANRVTAVAVEVAPTRIARG